MIPLQPHPERFRLSRAGIHQVWQYDEEFLFGGGRLLLRGKNGAGKSKALEMLLPFLLDGDTRKIDATGGGKTSLKWLMLDGWTSGTNRLGYLWVEFRREQGRGAETLTLGAAIKASTSTGDAKPLFFVTRRAVGDDLPLHDPDRRPAMAELRELVGAENCYERAADYRARVARELFGLTDLARYRNLVHLLHGLRRPTIGDRIESGELVKVLSDALPPLDDDVIDKVAHNLDDLDAVRAELARLERTDSALTTFLTAYRGYLRGVLRSRAGRVEQALTELRDRRREAGDAEREVDRLTREEETAAGVVESLEAAKETADTDLRALRESAAYGALQDLQEKRTTLQARELTASTAWEAAELARSAEQTAADRLRDETEGLGRELADLRGSLRKARQTSRNCGLDDALLGEPPSGRATPLAAPLPQTLTGVGGETHEVVRPGADALAAQTGQELAAWRERLGEADQVARARQRAAEVLERMLREAAEADRQAAERRQEAETLDGQLTDARTREEERVVELAAASAQYVKAVEAWATRLPDPAPLTALVAGGKAFVADEPDQPVLDQDVPEAVAATAHLVADPALADYEARRDDVLAAERGLTADLEAAEGELRHWSQQADPEPPRSRYSTADRPAGSGAPLFLLLDFDPSMAESDRPGLEAALEASGLLSAWVCADGTVLADGTREVLLDGTATAQAETPLSHMLRPVPGHGVSLATLDRLLGCIGLGESAAHSWVGVDGRWRLGVSRGAHGKDRAEYIGAAMRAATRQRRIAELTTRVAALKRDLEEAKTARRQLEELRDRLRTALREIPPARGLTDAWRDHETAVAETARLTVQLTAARREAERARTAAVKLRSRAEAQATTDALPADGEALTRLKIDLAGLRATIKDVLMRDADRILARLDAHRETQGSWERARQTRGAAEHGYDTARAVLSSARRELRLLEESIGSTEQEIIEREDEAQRRFVAAQQELPAAASRLGLTHDERIKAEAHRDTTRAELARQEQAVVASGSLLRRPLGLPGLPLAAALGDLETAIQAYDSTQEADVRIRINALRALAEDVRGRLGPVREDISDSLILRRGEELRDGLAGGYDAGTEEIDGIKRFALHDDTGAHDVAVVGERIRAALGEARAQLSAREQDVFERYLLGELGDHLSRQVLAAHTLVAVMNQTLDEVRSSHGIGARLQWELPDGTDADVKAAVVLLRRSAALRTRDQSARLRDALRRRIEDSRLADPSAGYAQHLRTALDYRSWFAFKVKVTDAANPDRERVLSHRIALSQGEQRVVSYLVLFATAAAHFSSLGGSAPHAPRLILLDDAFAKVDEPTHGRLLGLLVELDLDFVITSERLWGCFDTVPSLHIYECLRDPHVRGVATVHFTWDGRRRKLVGV